MFANGFRRYSKTPSFYDDGLQYQTRTFSREQGPSVFNKDLWYSHFPDEANSAELPSLYEVVWSVLSVGCLVYTNDIKECLTLVSVSKACTSLLWS